MIQSFLEMVVYTVVALLAVKMVFFRKGQPPKTTQQESLTWKSAADAMGIMEGRLTQLQERDLKQQERIWSLEDLNRDLQVRLARLTKELLLLNAAQSPPSPDADDEDEHDVQNSIPNG